MVEPNRFPILDLCNFQTRDVTLGSQTRWRDGVLQIDRDELLALIRQDPLVAKSDIQIARPGESTRIIDIIDIIEPRVKVEGGGTTYPGVYRRDGALVGLGRTHRLGGVAVMVCAPRHARMGYATGLKSSARRGDGNIEEQMPNFVDLSGPGADTPYSPLCNICVIVEPASHLDPDEAMAVVQRALLRISDRLAQTTVEQKPPEVETFDLTPKAGLPGYVYVNCILSPEAQVGNPDSPRGAAVYGVTRLTQPWLLYPTEVLDGAIFGNAGGVFPTWPLTNTIVLDMCRLHGKDFNFLGCIIVRTMWEEQWQKEFVANQTARMALVLGAQGAIVSPNWRGQRFLESILVVQACERAGVKTVFITEEEDNEDGTAPPLLANAPEAIAIVSSGTGSSFGPYPPVERVIGASEIDSRWYQELTPPHGRYGVSHLNDVYGFSRLTCVDY